MPPTHQQSSRALDALLLIGVLVLALFWGRLLANTVSTAISDWPNRDPIQYLCADEMFSVERNPYDPQVMKDCQSRYQRLTRSPLMMWTHPLSALIFSFFREITLNINQAIALWAISLIGSLFMTFVFILDISRRYFRMQLLPFLTLFLCMLTFPAIPTALFSLQMSPLLAFFATLSIWLCIREKYLLAGVSASMFVMKPHFAIYLPLVCLVFFFRLAFQSRKNIIHFCVGGMLGLTCIVFFCENFYPGSQYQWILSFLYPPEFQGAVIGRNEWKTSTGIGIFQSLTGMSWASSLKFGCAFGFLCILIMSACIAQQLSKKDAPFPHFLWVLPLLPWFYFFAPYGWLFDQVILLPAVLLLLGAWQIFERGWLIVLGFFIISGLALLQQSLPGTTQSEYAWVGGGYALISSLFFFLKPAKKAST
jgi:hypothetical protein